MTFSRNIVLWTALIPLLLPATPQKAMEPPLIVTILDGAAAYCQRLEHAAFRFTVLEKVRQRTHKRGVQRLVYDYQIVKEDGNIHEQRILKRRDGEAVAAPNENENQRFAAELFSYRAALAPIYLLGEGYRHRFRYALTGKRRMLDRSAWEVTLFRRPESPVPAPLVLRKHGGQAGLEPAEGEPRVVSVWIDREDFSVLGFRVYPAGISGYNKIVKAAFHRGLEVKVKDIHFFGLLRDGIRYPTRTEIVLTYSPLNPGSSPATGINSHVPGVSSALGRVGGGRRRASEIKVATVFTYVNHRFFTARSADPEYPDLQ